MCKLVGIVENNAESIFIGLQAYEVMQGKCP